MKPEERRKLEEELSELYQQKNKAIEVIDRAAVELQSYDRQILEAVGLMAQAGNQTMGLIYEQVQDNQRKLKQRCMQELDQLEEDYRKQKHQLQDRIDER
ncbi:hypothetical protein [Lactobacillus sp. PV034]|uniref:hypothetical protein n=1 Tax=Lactobacillus sp. PV034 TaxID=2594495 RepID=UPI0022402C28|nr:hypothetical protein [Lactobacillus sp. PV034]QNQ80634.1 hypothetical protein FP432_03245 [Lactobacillus sp. PV034]